MKTVLLAAALALLVTAPAEGVGYGSGDARLEELYSSFVAPCCWRDNLTIHDSAKAGELRAQIRDMVEAGQSDEEIKAAFVQEYGKRILTVPEGRTRGWLFWTPWLLAAAGAVVVVFYLRRLRHGGAQLSEETPASAPAE